MEGTHILMTSLFVSDVFLYNVGRQCSMRRLVHDLDNNLCMIVTINTQNNAHITIYSNKLCLTAVHASFNCIKMVHGDGEQFID
jgi:hypothetical protein